MSAAYSNCWWCFGNHYQELPRITHSRFKVHWSPISHQFFLFSLLLGWWLLILVLFLVYYSWCDRLTEQWVIYLSDNRLNKLFSLNCWGLKHLSDTSINLICRLCQGLTSLTICDNPLMTEQSLIPIIAMLTSLQNLNLWGCNNLSTFIWRIPFHIIPPYYVIADLHTISLSIGAASIQLLLRHKTKLQQLGLSFCSSVVTDNALLWLAKLTELKSLHFESCQLITDKSIGQDLGSPSIHTINFRKCTQLTSLALEECVLRCSNLTALNLGHCKLSNSGLLRFQHHLPKLNTVDLSAMKVCLQLFPLFSSSLFLLLFGSNTSS